MSHLYPHLRLHQVFGANTDVGKTIFTTALCLASSTLPAPSVLSQGSTAAGKLADLLTATKNEHEEAVKRAMASGQREGERVHYLKPVSTGPMEDSDDSHIALHAAPHSEKTLLRFSHAVSPHLAAQLSKPSASPLSDLSRIPTDAELVRSVGDWISSQASSSRDANGVAYIETAGGPHSPSPNGTSQVHLLRPLRLPTILIGDSNLGGISTTKSAYESLVIAGHQVDAILLFTEGKEDKWGNADYLTKWGKEVNVPVWGLAGLRDTTRALWGGPPDRASSKAEDTKNMKDFYRGLVFGRNRVEGDSQQVGGVVDVVRQLRLNHISRLRELETMAGRTRDSCWWPFTQHGLAKKDQDVTVIDSAHGDFFSTFRQATGASSSLNPSNSHESKLLPMLDGSASWWTQCLGHSHPVLAQTAAKAAGRYGHVLFPIAANAPSLALAETLLGRSDRSLTHEATTDHSPAPGKGWADRVFYSDNGSTGMEVALKMAIASSRQRYDPPALTDATSAKLAKSQKPGTLGGRPSREWRILGLKGSYHGDTIGAMDACEPSVYSKKVDWYRERGCWIDPPSVGLVNGKATITVPSTEEFPQHGSASSTYEYSGLQELYDVATRLEKDPLTKYYRDVLRSWLDRLVREEGHRFGALVIEPIILGAGGMIFVDPLFQRCMVDVVRESEDLFGLLDPPLREARIPGVLRQEGEWKGLPVIFDEVFTGLYRLGHSTPSTLLATKPDISCLAKILTGGLLPMSVTLASRSIFDTFTKGTDRKVDALLHGHSYTAHPIGCEVARESLRVIGGMDARGEWRVDKEDWGVAEASSVATTSSQTEQTPIAGIWSLWSREVVEELSKSDKVESTMAMGTVMVVHLKDAAGAGYSSTASQSLLDKLRLSPSVQQGHPSIPTSSSESASSTLPFNIHARPLGNVVYFMCSLNTPVEVRRETEAMLRKELLG